MDWTKEQSYICARCGYCVDVCPVYRPQGWESTSPRARLFIAGEDKITEENAKRIFECNLCGRCNEACQVDIDIMKALLDLRVRHRSKSPEGIDKLEEVLIDKRNVLDAANEERLRWTKRLRDINFDKKKGRVAYFTGCTAALFPALNSIPQSFVNILEHVKEDYFILGSDEWCCGFPLISLGMPDVSEEFILHNVEMINKSGVETVVTTCPGCYKVFKDEYEEVVGDLIDFEIMHSTQYITKMMDEGKIKLGTLDTTVTYHDPCDLGRKGGIYEEPRKILENMPGVKFTELFDNKKDCSCCGGGGSLIAINPDLAADVTQHKIDEIKETKAENLISACQTCKKNIRQGAMKDKAEFKVSDIVELVSSQIK